MRKIAIGCVILFGLLSAGTALAKDKKKKDDEGILPTGISSFDDVFARVGEIDGRLKVSEGQLRSAKRNLNDALELKRGTPVSTGLAQLKQRAEGKLQLAVDDKAVPKLKTADGVPPNVQHAVDAVNEMTGNFTNTLSEMQGLTGEIESLIKETRKMPENLKKEFSKGNKGLLDTLLKLPKTSKALTHDIEITKNLPTRVGSLTDQMTGILGDLKSEFPLTNGPSPAPRPRPAPDKREGSGGGDKGGNKGGGDKGGGKGGKGGKGGDGGEEGGDGSYVPRPGR